MSERRTLVIAIAALTVAITTAALTVVVITEPRRWFEDAYASEGSPGPQGPRGDVGRAGPPGPVGADAEEAVAALESDLADVQARVDELELALEELQSGAGGSELEGMLQQAESDLEELQTQVTNICDEFSFYDGAFSEIYLAAC